MTSYITTWIKDILVNAWTSWGYCVVKKDTYDIFTSERGHFCIYILYNRYLNYKNNNNYWTIIIFLIWGTVKNIYFPKKTFIHSDKRPLFLLLPPLYWNNILFIYLSETEQDWLCYRTLQCFYFTYSISDSSSLHEFFCVLNVSLDRTKILHFNQFQEKHVPCTVERTRIIIS